MLYYCYSKKLLFAKRWYGFVKGIRAGNCFFALLVKWKGGVEKIVLKVSFTKKRMNSENVVFEEK